jgi:N-acetylmuramoyl-L-alanine amidase
MTRSLQPRIKTSYIKIIFFFIIIPLLFSHAIAAKGIPVVKISGRNYVSLYHFIDAFNIENSFDVTFQKGRLYYKSHYVVYKTGYSILIVDNRILSLDDPVLRWKGGIYIPADGALMIVDSFFAGTEAEIRGSRIVLNRKSSSDNINDKSSSGNNQTGKEHVRSREKIGFIIIDPGHGGKDPGAIGKGGLQEKGLTLQLARRVEKMLKSRLKDIKIKSSRNKDVFIELAERTEIANRELKKGNNGLFISIHVNASISSKISGFETYYLSQNPTNEEARKTAALENNVVILERNSDNKKKYDDVDQIEALMMTTQIQRESALLAESIQKNMDKNIRGFRSRGVQRADFFVLRGALMPAVLVEVGFITNSREASFLQRADHQNKVSKGICDGIADFIKEYNKMIKQ